MVSQTISHYHIIKKLGAGGMGEVYLAEDTRLNRQVAIKLLPPSYKYDADRRARFLKEARMASALRSPNVVAIYDIGEHDDSVFIVMEYVEGELLSDKLSRGPLPLDDALDMTIQIANALDEAHSYGIIHRDIKTANLIITDRGLVKVLDFGLAKNVAPGYLTTTRSGDDSDPTQNLDPVTASGVIMGTVSYMSPEQARGLKLDARTDIFSLGVVLYRMITGRAPFEGETTSDLIVSILKSQPPPLARYSPTAPDELERIVTKALAKVREERYQTAQDLLIDLRRLKQQMETGAELQRSGESDAASHKTKMRADAQTAEENVFTSTDWGQKVRASRRRRSRKAINSLAVLPMTNAAADPNVEYLSDGLTESIINTLSRLPKLRVMARSTVFRYKVRDPQAGQPDPQEVGHHLGVGAVLTGKVQQFGDRIMIKVELVDVADGSQLWGEHYNRKLTDIFAIEEEISREISEKLRLKLSGEEKKQLAKRHTLDPEAYQAYLKGRYYWNKRTAKDLKKGIEYFEQAIQLDPNYAQAYAGLADSYSILGIYNALPPKAVMPKTKAAAMKALEIDDTLAEAHTALAGAYVWFDWDWAAAERKFRRAIELNPSYAMSHHWYASIYLTAMGKFDEALAEEKRALELDPLSLVINAHVGWIHYHARQYDQAIAQYLKTLEIDADFVPARFYLGLAYVQKAMFDEAIAELSKAVTLSGGGAMPIGALGHAYAVSGQRSEALKLLDELTEISKRRYVSPFYFGLIYTGLGDLDQAFTWLEKARDERFGWLIWFKTEPMFDSLRSDARYKALLGRIGHEM